MGEYQIIFDVFVFLWLVILSFTKGRKGERGFTGAQGARGEKGDKGDTVYVEVKGDK